MTLTEFSPRSSKLDEPLWLKQARVEAYRTAKATQTAATPPLDTINAVYRPHLDNSARVQIFYGGASSGKSVFLAQRDVLSILGGKRNALVCRQVGRTLRGSVVQEVHRVITAWGLAERFSVNKSDGTVTCIDNGCQIVFVGLDDVEKLKSIVPAKGVFTDVRIEEATETESKSVRQMFKRQRGGDPETPKRLTLSFNPVLKSHWIYTEYFSRAAWADDQREYRSEALSILKTTHIDNRFLTDDDRADLESEADTYLRDVYTLGNWGILGNVIFRNWRVEDLAPMRDQFTNLRNGLDFGFSDDPAAAVATHYDRSHKTIYIFGELYERGLTNDILAIEARALIGREPVTCDSAEPKSIAELQQNGVSAMAAKKGKDSVTYGIQWLQQQTIVIDTTCINARNEFSGYHWREDKAGNALRQPVDKNDHIISALRYAYEDETESYSMFPRHYTHPEEEAEE